MAQYALRTSSFASGQVGSLYHIGLSNGTQQYGYIFQNQGQQSAGIQEESNIADKDKLIQYSSPNLIDRDLAFFPRVTQGDVSGGALQAVFIDPTKYFDSDLEIRTAGYLTLRPGWVRTQLATGLGAVTPQSVAWNSSIYTTFQGATYYNAAGTGFTPPFNAKFIDTDGKSLIVGDGVNNISFTYDNSSFSSITTAASAFIGMWVVQQGTNGRFVYVAREFVGSGATAIHTIYKLDENATLPTTPVQLPTGNAQIFVVDIDAYQNGIAILTRDSNGFGFDVWYHDGTNMVRIVRVNEYQPVGMTVCLGDLYVTGQSTGQFEAPVLIRVSTGTFEVVVRTASPLATLTSATIGAPVSTGQYVYFTLGSPQLKGVTTTSYVGVYDVVTGAYSHLGNLDSLDAPPTTGVRQLAFSGRAAAFPMVSAGTGFLQSQTNSSQLPSGNTYVASGTLVGSKYDFGTPGIPKRFRRIEAVHNKPLATGESVTLKMFVDQDPVAYTSSLTPTATVTNSTVGSALTELTAGADTVGRTLYPVAVLNGPGTSTPSINRMAVEIGGTWTWTFELDCSNNRRLLNSESIDPQGVTGKDLYYLLRNAYENGTLLTLFLAEGVSYTVTIESLKARNPAYLDHLTQGQQPVKADEEWLVSAVLKQVA